MSGQSLRLVGPGARREYAIRLYHGIGPDGRFIEPKTQQEIADEIGVSRQTVDSWVNGEIPLVDGLDENERWTILACVMTRSEEDLVEYLHLVGGESESPNLDTGEGDEVSPQSANDDSDPYPFPEEGVEW